MQIGYVHLAFQPFILWLTGDSYDNGLMGGLVAEAAFDATFDNPNSVMTSLIVSIMEVGAFFGSIFTAFTGERLGRRKTIATGVTIMILGSLLQATAYSRAHMIVARIVASFGLGTVNSTVPVMMAEFAPKANRGLCTAFLLLIW